MTPTTDLSEMTTIVVGASRGLGRGITTAFAEAGAPVIAVARTAAPLADQSAGGGIRAESADAGDPTVAGSLLDRYEPTAVIVVAGARPLVRPLQHHTWETFSVNWHTDVRIAFHWLREALLKPLRPGSRVVVISRGAALQGSPLSEQVRRRQVHPAVHLRLRPGGGHPRRSGGSPSPRCCPGSRRSRTSVGRHGPARTRPAAASRPSRRYLQQPGEPLTPEVAGAALVELVRKDAPTVAPAYLLTSAGLQTLP